MKFNRIGQKQYLTTFNGRAEIYHYVQMPQFPISEDSNNNPIYDYLENLKSGSNSIQGGDVAAVIREFNDIKTESWVEAANDAGKILKWQTDKFVAGDDLAGIDVSSLTEANFAKSQGDPASRAITADDIKFPGGIDFNVVSGTDGLYSDYINLNPLNTSVDFNFPLTSGTDANGQQYSMNNLGPITGVLNGTIYSSQ